MVTHGEPARQTCRRSAFVNAESSERMPDSRGADMRSVRRAGLQSVVRDAGNHMSTSQVSPTERITAVVRRILADRSIVRTFAPQEDLREVGLTSLDMVNLVLAV